MSGPTARARLEGKVHGVVVHASALTGPPALQRRAAGWPSAGASSSKATVTAGS